MLAGYINYMFGASMEEVKKKTKKASNAAKGSLRSNIWKKNIEKDIEKLCRAKFLQGSRLSSSH